MRLVGEVQSVGSTGDIVTAGDTNTFTKRKLAILVFEVTVIRSSLESLLVFCMRYIHHRAASMTRFYCVEQSDL